MTVQSLRSSRRPRFQRLAFASVWLALGCLPLAAAPGFFVNHDAVPKLALLALAVALPLLSPSEWTGGIRSLYQARLGRAYLGSCLAIALSLVLSTIFSSQPSLSLAGTTWRRYGLVTQIMVLALSVIWAGWLVQGGSLSEHFLPPLFLAGSVLAVFCVVQFAGLDPLFDPQLYSTKYFGTVRRPPGTMGHAIYLGTFLAAVALLATARVLGKNRWRDGWPYVLVAASATLGVLLTGSRSAVAGAAAGGMVLFWAGRSGPGRRRLARVAAIGLAAIAVAIGLLSVANPSFRLRLDQWQQDAWGGPRLMVWDDSVGLVEEAPWLGAGLETFGPEFRRIESAELANAYPDSYHESPHNLILDVLTAQGWFGAAALFALVGVCLAAGYRAVRKANAFAAGLAAAFISVAVAFQFVPVTIPNAVMFFGLAAALISAETVDRSQAVVSRTLRWGCASVAALALLLGWLYLQQDLTLLESARAAEAVNLAEARDAFWAVQDLPFPKPGENLWLSRKLAALAQTLEGERRAAALQLALEASHRAESSGEQPSEAIYQSAVLLLARGDFLEAEKKLAEVIGSAPTWYKGHLLRSQALLFLGRTAEAQKEVTRAREFAGIHKDEIVRDFEKLLNALDEAKRAP